MIKELREIGRVNDAPILIVHLDLAKKEWVGLGYKNNVELLSICFWSTRDDERMSVNELIDVIVHDVAVAKRAVSTQQGSETLFDIQYKLPLGWDRWLGGVPRPLRGFFDDTLHPKLRALLKTIR